MDYKITKNANDDVEIIKKAGNDYVLTSMPSGQAIALIETASKIEKSDIRPGFEISLNDGEIIIAGTLGKATAKAEKATDEPVKAEKKPVAKKATAKKKAE